VDTGEFEGTIALNVLNTGAIVDGDFNPLDAPYVACQSAIVDTAAPGAPVMDAEPVYTNGYENTVSWAAVTGADTYHIACYADAGLSTLVAEDDTAGTSYSFTGLADGVEYWYRVYGQDTHGNTGAWSSPVSSIQSGELLAVHAQGPVAVAAKVGDEVTLEVAVTGATGSVTYQWYRLDGGKATVPIGDDNPVYSFTAALEDDGVLFYCEATDDADVAVSDNFALSVAQGVPVATAPVLLILGLALAVGSLLRLRKASTETR
jgi:hypothetical protein